MVLLAFGSRGWNDLSIVVAVFRKLRPDRIITGDAFGADLCVRHAARILLIPAEVFAADWKTYGRAAGPRRNAEMVAHGPDQAVAFVHGDLKFSRGTADTVRRLRSAGIPYRIVTTDLDSYK